MILVIGVSVKKIFKKGMTAMEKIYYNAIIAAAAGLLLVCSDCTNAQMTHAQQDSVLLINVANDTVQLHHVTIDHQGERTSAKAHNRLGAIFFKNKKYDDAEQEFMSTYHQYLNTPEALEATGYLGRINYVRDRFEQAKSYYKEFLSNNPTGGEAQWALYCLVRSMRQTNDSDFVNTARSYFASPHDSTKGRDINIQYDLVRFLAYRQQYAQAIAEAETLMSRYPTSPYVTFVEPRIADYYLLSGNTQAAINQCNNLLTKYPANTDNAARAQYMLSGFYTVLKEFDRARSEYAKIPQSHPAQAEWINSSQYGLALVDLEEGMERSDSSLLLRALTGLEAFVSNHPDNHNVPQADLNLANLYTRQADYGQSLTAYNRVMAFDSTLIDTGKYTSHSDEMRAFRNLVLQAHLAKAMLLRTQMHDAQAAIAEYDTILASHPDRADMLLNKALCLVDLNRKADARQILEQLVANQSQVRETAARILESL